MSPPAAGAPLHKTKLPHAIGKKVVVAKGLSLLYRLSHSLWRMLCQLTGGMMPASIHP